MPSLKDKFDEIRLRLQSGRDLDGAGTEPIFYLVFPVAEILDVKRQTKAWTAKLENEGWRVVTLSMTDALERVLQPHKLRNLWLSSEKLLIAQAEKSAAPLDCREINKTLAKALSEKSRLSPELAAVIDAKVAETASSLDGLLLITDLEALHPYLRINAIEDYLRGRAAFPIVVLYPGAREGKTSLRFLEFYPADPNYRSDHIG